MRIPPGNPEHLAFSDHVCCFDPLNQCPSYSRGSGSLHGTQPSFNVTVIGFDAVIAVATRPLTTPLRHTTVGLQFTNGRRTTPQSVSRKDQRRLIVGIGQCPM